jgi:hypothetical protein
MSRGAGRIRLLDGASPGRGEHEVGRVGRAEAYVGSYLRRVGSPGSSDWGALSLGSCGSAQASRLGRWPAMALSRLAKLVSSTSAWPVHELEERHRRGHTGENTEAARRASGRAVPHVVIIDTQHVESQGAWCLIASRAYQAIPKPALSKEAHCPPYSQRQSLGSGMSLRDVDL